VAEIRRYAEEANRDLTSRFLWTAFVFVNIAGDDGAARDDALRFFDTTFGRDLGSLLDRVAAVGTPSRVAARLQEFVAAGARHLVIAPATRGDAHTMVERFATNVMPLLDV
jgi:alkanesulfonate monooxygenase SsuD/methylene tetrahydromethanopterin reductase-like flavin-dependent oxidoreductase (luciferase family)